MRCTAIGTSSIANATWPSPALPARMSGRSAKRSKVLAATNGHANVVSYAASMPLSSFHHSLGSRFVAPGLVATDHYVEVPLDYTDPMSEKITVFVRELIAPNRMDIEQPGLLYLQGGPGFEGPRATEASAWVKSALMHFKVYLMDQRGTGLSNPITPDTLPKRGSPAEQAQYLSHFRADSIVADAEVLRRFLVRQDGVCKGRWTVLGQSFGGICALTYLSFAPNGLYEVMLTGGIPPGVDMPCSAETAYRALFQRVLTQNAKYYKRFPGDITLVQRIVQVIDAHPDGGPTTPCGNRLSVRLFLTLGLGGLGSFGGFERLHYLLERAFDGQPAESASEISYSFLKGFDGWLHWDSNPLYALLHEAIYCQGAASQWAAQRVLDSEFGAEFDAVARADAGEPVNFTGEMVFPFMFEDVAALRPLRDAAELLARTDAWPRLYDPAALSTTSVPVVAASYVEDMYVDWHLVQDTVKYIKGIRQWSTSEYMHSGVRDDGAALFDRLLGMARGSIPLY